MGKNDRFANIAAAGMHTDKDCLTAPKIRKPAVLPLPLTAGPGSAAVLNAPCSPQEALDQTMAALRAHYKPFMTRQAPAYPSTRTRQELTTFQWRKATDADRQDFLAALLGQGQWETVTVPHYAGPLGKAETLYRTTFTLEQLPAADEALFLHFGGVDYIAHVFLNGRYLGSHEGMFAPFEFDCTACVHAGENTLLVRVENDFTLDGSKTEEDDTLHTGNKIYAATGPGYDDPAVGWHHCPPGMGIYQTLWLERRPRQFIHDLFVRPLCEQAQAELHIDAYSCDIPEKAVRFQISVNGRNFTETVVEELTYVPETGRFVGMGDSLTQANLKASGLLQKPVPMPLANGINFFTVTIPMGSFRLWEPDTPWLYEVQVRMLDSDGQLLDVQSCAFGMRSFTMDTESEKKGMLYLNGKKCRLRGANTMGFEQQDVMRGDFDQLVEDLLLAKACNMNFLRLTQRPVQDEIYQYCDMLGLMIQTDLPMFGVLRRNQFAEAVRQAGEMERLIRKHPCCIMVTYINEPFPNANNQPHRNLSRKELMDFFDAADLMVHLENPDRVIKHVDGDYDPPSKTLPDNHCYPCWYNGHGIDAGDLHKGDWLPVNKGWYYACGEYGAEGLDPADLMRRRYPASWLPHTAEEEANWSPNSIVNAQTGNFHYFFFETPDNLEEWAARSQDHQAEATKWMTEAFRRNRDMVSFAIHLFIDAWPSGWMKTIVDCERGPKPGFFAYQSALTPTMVSLRTDRFTYTAGETAAVELWLCNDRPEPMDLTLHYEAGLPDGTVVSGQQPCRAEGSDAAYAGEVQLSLPEVPGPVTLRCAVTDETGTVLHRNELELQTYAHPAGEIGTKIHWAEDDAAAAALMAELCIPAAAPEEADCVVIGSYDVYARQKDVLDPWVANGGKLVFLEQAPGEYEICGQYLPIQYSSMLPMHFVSRNTGHPWVRDFGPKTFRRWYNAETDRVAPLLESTFVHPDMQPVLTSGNTDENGRWGKTLAVGQMAVGSGSLVLCQLKLTGRVRHNPAARIFAQRMLAE